jgi:hypothetical protein
MIKLDEGNVLLKPSNRKQLMAWLKRPLRLGAKLGHFVLTLTLQRNGRAYDVRATVQDSAGRFACHSRKRDWRGAIRDLIRLLNQHLHQQLLQRAI